MRNVDIVFQASVVLYEKDIMKSPLVNRLVYRSVLAPVVKTIFPALIQALISVPLVAELTRSEFILSIDNKRDEYVA